MPAGMIDSQPIDDGANLRAVIRYDGTRFAGWQIQLGLRTVQGEIESALSQIAGRLIRIAGAGRTDAGVHALGQVFSCRWPGQPDCDRLRRALSAMLAPEMRVERLEVAPPEFHACKSAIGKRYAYSFLLARTADPFTAPYAWTLRWDVDPRRLAELAQRLVGTHDFAGFQSSGSNVNTTVRTVHSVQLKEGGVVGPCDAKGLWRLEFHGNGFLYKMVRNITCTLVDIVRGNLPETRLDERLAAPAPSLGHTAPPHGLTLLEVDSPPLPGTSESAITSPPARSGAPEFSS
jgi:tRNA pseudouridine38-40 synthase